MGYLHYAEYERLRLDRYKDVKLKSDGSGIEYTDVDMAGCKASASWTGLLIHEAWNRGVDFEDLADGFGPGEGTHGDWSALRDSSPEAKQKMVERALNYLFPSGKQTMEYNGKGIDRMLEASIPKDSKHYKAFMEQKSKE